MPASYLSLSMDDLRLRAKEAVQALSDCRLCPRLCSVDRTRGELGWCKTGRLALVSGWDPHFGEEAPLVGKGGSGTIFFSGCNLACVFCQNWEISQGGIARSVSARELADIMLELQGQGCVNINFVTPSHVPAQILEALPLAVDKGLTLPLVYNSSGYDLVETLRLFDGIVDIYLPDAKFADGQTAKRLCKAEDYPERARAALQEMQRQTGDLQVNASGVAERGLLVRHLVMPGGLAATRDWAEFIARDVSPRAVVNVMGQYHPCHKAGQYEKEFPDICRRPTSAELAEARAAVREAGLTLFESPQEDMLLRLLRALD